MPTKRLLGLLGRLRACEPSIGLYDGQSFPPSYRPDEFIYFKDDLRWPQQYLEMKRAERMP